MVWAGANDPQEYIEDADPWNDLALLLQEEIIEDDVAQEALVFDTVKRIMAERAEARAERRQLCDALADMLDGDCLPGCPTAYGLSCTCWQEKARIALA